MNPPFFFTILGIKRTEETNQYDRKKETSSDKLLHYNSILLVKKLDLL